MTILIATLETFLNFFARMVGSDVTILPDAPGRSWLDFERRPHGPQFCEYFGLGLHLIVATNNQSH